MYIPMYLHETYHQHVGVSVGLPHRVVHFNQRLHVHQIVLQLVTVVMGNLEELLKDFVGLGFFLVQQHVVLVNVDQQQQFEHRVHILIGLFVVE